MTLVIVIIIWAVLILWALIAENSKQNNILLKRIDKLESDSKSLSKSKSDDSLIDWEDFNIVKKWSINYFIDRDNTHYNDENGHLDMNYRDLRYVITKNKEWFSRAIEELVDYGDNEEYYVSKESSNTIFSSQEECFKDLLNPSRRSYNLTEGYWENNDFFSY